MSAILDITRPALARSRLTLLVTAILMLIGAIVALDFPSSEEPAISIRVAVVTVVAPGLSSERVENLIAKPLEVAVREIAEVKRTETFIRPGFLLSYVTLSDAVTPAELPIVYQRLRAKMSEVQQVLPPGSIGPLVNDEFGRTSVLVLALTGPDFERSELNGYARDLRDRLAMVEGAEKASVHGIVEDRIKLILNFDALRSSGLSPAVVISQLTTQNVILPGGESVVDGLGLALEVSGSIERTEDFADLPISLPTGGALRLGDVAQIQRASAEQPDTAAVLNGEYAVVVGVSMRTGVSIQSFSQRLLQAVEEVRHTLPAGMTIDVVADQAEVVAYDIGKVGTVFLETVGIVMVVVILFLGFRSGLIVGTVVPLTMLASLVVMRLLSIELHSISIAALIIALGLLVDNGIVIVEDVERRLAEGEDRDQACIEAGRTLAIPLLVSCLTVILAFMPLVLAQTSTGEYMRSLGQVVAITLLISWGFSLTVVPLLCRRFAKPHAKSHGDDQAVYDTGFFRGYRRVLESALRHRFLYVAGMVGLLVGAAWQLGQIPQSLLPPSNRPAIQIPMELPPGTTSAETLQLATSVSQFLSDHDANPDLKGNVVYVGDGGPRFILGLNPPLPATNRAYAVVTLAKDADPDAVIRRLRTDLNVHFPEASFEPKRFSLGSGDAGTAVIRLIGEDDAILRDAAERLVAALAQKSGIDFARHDAEGLIGRLVVDVDQNLVRQAGLSSEDVAVALRTITSGEQVSVFRENDIQVPVTLRGMGDERLNPASLGSLPIFSQDGVRSALLAQIAEVRFVPQQSIIQRRDGQRYVTVLARGEGQTAQEIADQAVGEVEKLGLPDGYTIQLGGEIEDSAEVGGVIGGLLPLCVLAMVALFVWQFNSFRRTIIILASIPFGIIGVSVGLTVAGASLSFTGILGILALAGIIVNNAILLLERIDVEEATGLPRTEAVLAASVKRFRPIIMTKLVCVLGLVPLLLFGGALWYPMAAGMIGGLLLGTLVTLGLVPVLYSWFYPQKAPPVLAPTQSGVLST